MNFKLTTFALAALLVLGAGAVHAQGDEPAAETAAGDNTGTATDKAAARAARIARRRALIAARRAAMARAQTVPPADPSVAPRPEAIAKPVSTDLEKAAPIDAEGPLDTQPTMARVNEANTPEHEGTAAGPSPESSAQLGPGHKAHGEGDAEHLADHGEHTGFSVKTFALQLFNFGVLLFILIWFGGRAMNKSLRARHEQLKGDINEAARLRDEAAQKFKAQDQRVADLEKEVAALRATLRQDAEREQVRLLEGAQERAKKIQDEMRFQLSQQVKEAELLLRAEVASASVRLAEELVRKSLNTDDQRRLAQEFVAGFDVPVGPGGAVG
jgi:F-type H+-transporting ATPase subunit b